MTARTEARRRLLVAVAALAVLAGCGEDEEPAQRDPFRAIEQEFERARDDVRAAPRWEQVTVESGEGTAERAVAIDADAIQWRVSLRCEAGAELTARSDGVDAEARCGGRPAEFIGTGEQSLAVAGSGRWRAVVEQQVETPAAEPPLPGSGRPLLAGEFGDIERRSQGRALVHRSRGRLVLRLEDFQTAATADLFVWISPARAPRTTRQALRAPHREIAPLEATRGDQNYVLPRGVTLAGLRSVVIWCEPIRIAYTAAGLRRPQG